jgi:propanol-preferring alcohol dehydrogenase
MGEILIKVRVCGVCRTDLHVVEGDLPPRLPGVIPGHQVVGDVIETGKQVGSFQPGDRVGVAWLHRTCGSCGFCLGGRENLCHRAEFTGWTVHGGYAEYLVAPARFSHRLPESFADLAAAPLLCAGIIGFRSLRLAGLGDVTAFGDIASPWKGARLGIYGFGAAGHVAIQVARFLGAEVFVSTRDRTRHQALAAELGAAWVGGADESPPVKLDAAIIFAPAGPLVPRALGAIEKGGTLVLAGIHMSDIPSMGYSLLYDERVIRSVANNTLEDARNFLDMAARIPVRTEVTEFPLEAAPEALRRLKSDAIRGAAVLTLKTSGGG